MRKKELDRWGKYVRRIANELGLRDWELFLLHDTLEDDYMAKVSPTEGKKHATITLCVDWPRIPADIQRQAVVHELIHLHLVSATDIVRLDVCHQLSQAAYDVMFPGFKRQIEYAVDGLADAIAPYMSLPRDT